MNSPSLPRKDGYPTATVGHMPFAGHRTCADWLPRPQQPTTAGNIGIFAPAYVSCEPKNRDMIARDQRLSRNRQLYAAKQGRI